MLLKDFFLQYFFKNCTEILYFILIYDKETSLTVDLRGY